MTRQTTRCHYCDQTALFLCDFALPKGVDGKARTCDRWLCPTHRVQCARFIACTRGTKGRKGCVHDTIDYCTEHAAQKDAQRGLFQ